MLGHSAYAPKIQGQESNPLRTRKQLATHRWVSLEREAAYEVASHFIFHEHEEFTAATHHDGAPPLRSFRLSEIKRCPRGPRGWDGRCRACAASGQSRRYGAAIHPNELSNRVVGPGGLEPPPQRVRAACAALTLRTHDARSCRAPACCLAWARGDSNPHLVG